MKRTETILFMLLMAILVPLELLCASLAFHTLGEVTSRFYFILVGLNLAFVILALRRWTAAAAIGAVVLAMAVLPYQLMLGDRLLRVQAEAAQIVSYAYEQKIATGQYPADLRGYEFHDPEMKPLIQEYRRDGTVGGFILAYRVGTESTSHLYSPQNGWTYYPD